jgi:hypothetical protein
MIRVRSDSRALVAAEAATPGKEPAGVLGRIRMSGVLPRNGVPTAFKNAYLFCNYCRDGFVPDI